MGRYRNHRPLAVRLYSFFWAPLLATCVVSLVGCSSQKTGGMPNPFITADRVPAPATRVPPQGAAQPYYPGDPLPAFQQGAIQPSAPASFPVGEPDIRPIPSGEGFVSNQPTAGAAASVVATASNEPQVSIPTDNSDLRFAAAVPEVVTSPPTRVAMATPAQTVAPATAQTMANSRVELPSQQQPVQPREVVIETPPQAAPEFASVPSFASSGPRVTLTPVDALGTSDGMFRAPTVSPSVTSMPTAERVVPASYAAPAGGATPRIRLPNAGSLSQQPVQMPHTISTTSYHVPAPQPHEVARTSEVTTAGPTVYTPSANYNTPMRQGFTEQAAAISADGFRPRGSSREATPSISEAGVGQLLVTPQPTLPTVPQTSGVETYGYGPSYEWLRGRLEYSSAVGYWKIRYLPATGSTDEFGGSVAIANSDVLATLRPGDFVELHGQLVAGTGQGPSFSPSFTVYTVRRL